MSSLINDEDWALVASLLPRGWQRQARKTGAVRRLRGTRSITNVLRLLLLHIAGGLSIEQTCVRARELGLAQVTAMALFKRLRRSGDWLAWLCAKMMAARTPVGLAALPGRRLLAVDASDISEPGATGSSWRLHYALALPELRCAHAVFTGSDTGESLCHLPVQAGDIVMADRAYGKRQQLAWVVDRQADAVVRISPSHLPVTEQSDVPCDWVGRLAKLKGRQPGEWAVRFAQGGKTYTARVCAVRKSLAARERARHAIEVEARKKHRTVRPETWVFADYVIVLTTLPRQVLDTGGVLELYRCRWQVELAFKRLKSLLAGGSVPKSDPASARAWMQGKLLEALLVEELLSQAGAFSPWGYRLGV
jgi:hypothetical protein